MNYVIGQIKFYYAKRSGRAHLVVAELLAEGREQVAQFRGGDEPVAVLVEVAQALDEVVGGVAAARLRDRLPRTDRQLFTYRYDH